MPRTPNPLEQYNYLMEKADLLLNKKKRELKGCKECKKVLPLIGKTGKCKECAYSNRTRKESINEGKIWLSPGDGFMKIYVKEPSGKLVVKNLHREVVANILGRPLLRSEKIIFKDNNKENCEPSNLLLISDQAIALTCSHCERTLGTPVVP